MAFHIFVAVSCYELYLGECWRAQADENVGEHKQMIEMFFYFVTYSRQCALYEILHKMTNIYPLHRPALPNCITLSSVFTSSLFGDYVKREHSAITAPYNY